MPRYCITLEYDGTPFSGWQRQEGALSIQQVIEEALRFTGEGPLVLASGRTDAGVHACGQVAHFDLMRSWPPERLQGGLNHFLHPAPISILSCQRVADDFHARFSCKGRRYLYRIVNRQARLALEAGRAWLVSQKLDEASMHQAAQSLIGHHDFTSFRASHCQASSALRTLDELTVSRHGVEIRIEAAARSFLHHQVRNMAGSLALVGLGKWRIEDIARALSARDRRAGGPTAPACGLYFMAACYENTN